MDWQNDPRDDEDEDTEYSDDTADSGRVWWDDDGGPNNE